MSPNEASILIEMMSEARRSLSNNMCNDFKLPNTPENVELLKNVARFSMSEQDAADAIVDIDSTAKKNEVLIYYDWMILGYLVSRFKNMHAKMQVLIDASKTAMDGIGQMG